MNLLFYHDLRILLKLILFFYHGLRILQNLIQILLLLYIFDNNTRILIVIFFWFRD